MVFLKFIFITLVIFWFAGLVLRAVFARFLRRQAEQYDAAVRGAKRRSNSKKEGEISVERRTEPQRRVREKVGEYVDFEEVS